MPWPAAGRRVGTAILAASIAAAIVPAIRTPVLRAAGRVLVAEDPIGRADVILVATGADGAGVLEAADLVQAGVASHVAVFSDPPDPVVDREFLRRGVAYEDAAARSIRQLHALGVGDVEQIPQPVAGTVDEGRALPQWCAARGLRSVVVVTTSDHSRRLRRLLRRSMEGGPTQVAVRPARHSPFDAAHWWQTRQGARIEVIELQKLVLDVLTHPLS